MKHDSGRRNPDWTWEEEVLAFATYIRHETQGNSSHPAVGRLSEILRSLPIHDPAVRTLTFRNRNSVARKLADIHTHRPGFVGKPTSGSKLDRDIWRQFGHRISEALKFADLIERELIDGQVFAVNADDDENTFPEGKILYSFHRRRERSSSLRSRKLKRFRERHGRIFCEACELDLGQGNGNTDLDVYECHHLVPLHLVGPTESGLDDLVVLCPTCHRIAHKVRPWPDLQQLRTIRKSAGN